MKQHHLSTLLAIAFLAIAGSLYAQESPDPGTEKPKNHKEVAAFAEGEPPAVMLNNSKQSMRVAAFGGMPDAVFYDNGGKKAQLIAGSNSLASAIPLPKGEVLKLYKQVLKPVEGTDKTLTTYLDVGTVKLPGGSKAIVLLIVPEDLTKEKIKGRAFADSFSIHPAETARVFNLSPKVVAIRAGKESLKLPVGETGIMPWKAVAFNSIAYQIGTVGEKEGTWDLVESAECAAPANMRTFVFIAEVVGNSKRTLTATTVFDPLPDTPDQ
ncbi:MAG: hypothetical protein ABI600_21485 [Luteolibacter sp.]